GANLAFAASPAHIQGRARPPSLPSPRGGRSKGKRVVWVQLFLFLIGQSMQNRVLDFTADQ
ncbi:hypothetical protein, partial [Comamonas kerstersii]|uniref:hypothetical protein n=1 Tax=Comamonas kerstersii TaxID=225992 RepID=UPI001A915977